jgi:hypothetical protein
MSAKVVGLIKMLIDKETLSGIMGGMPATDWKQLVKKRPVWTQEEVSSAFEKFCDQLRDEFNNAASETIQACCCLEVKKYRRRLEGC